MDKGLEMAAKLLNGVVAAPFKYMAIGSGTTAEATSQTALVTELSGGGASRVECTCGYEASSNKSTWSHTFTNSSGSTWNINEFAIFDQAIGGNMFARHKFTSAKNVDDGGSITITLKNPTIRGA